MQHECRIGQRMTLALIAACFPSTFVLAHTGSGITVDGAGQVYFLDTGSGLWKIDTHGKLAQLSETRFHWLAIDTDNRFASTRLPSGTIGDITKVGTNPTLLLFQRLSDRDGSGR